MTGHPDGDTRVGPYDDPDRYVVGPTVAAGAEGILFRGSIARAGVRAEVAVKMLQPRYLPRVDEWHTLWDDQVHLLRSLQTPGVVGVHEGFLGSLPHPPGQVGDSRTLYLVMNWVDGEPLDEWVRRRPDRDPYETLNLLLGVATALDVMHSGHFTRAPVVHRDVKPANILVTDNGTVLVDFGLTRALPDGPRLSGINGTVGYLAPEATDQGIYTPATDRYALGAVAYFIFTGSEPPKSHHAAALRASLNAVPALADRPEAVDHLMAMLDDDPDARPSPLSNWVGQVRRSTLGEPEGAPVARPWRLRPPVVRSGSAEDFQRSLSKLADALITLENSGHLELVRAQRPAGETAGSAASRLLAVMDDVWLKYPLVKAVGERLAAVTTSDHPGDAGHLLGPHAVTLPDGTTTSAVSLVAELQGQTEEVAGEAAILAKAGLDALARLEAAEPTMQELRAQAAAIGATGDHALTSAFESVVQEQKTLAQDLFRPTADLEHAVAEARLCLHDLEQVRDALPKRMADARLALAEIEELIVIGADESATAVDKIREPAGLRAPIDSERLDRGESALRPWLARIERDAETGQWRAADEGLTRWSSEAATLRLEASEICEANEAPMAARKELRGLLDSYRAMACAMGMAEDALLSQLYEEACTALYEAPCDLAAADRKVRIYIDAVNGHPPSETR